MEAMSYGIPCVGTNVGGVIEIVNNENGFLFEVNFKSDSLAKTIVDFAFKSKLDRLKFIENSLITFENRFQLDVNIKLFIKFLFGEKH
jgi:glycosyltransferase involved in cell wall biosynthesis